MPDTDETLGGNIDIFKSFEGAVKENEEIASMLEHIADEHCKREGKAKFDGAEYPVLGYQTANVVWFLVSDPVVT